jgi:two-component system, LytTR family, response regulator
MMTLSENAAPQRRYAPFAAWFAASVGLCIIYAVIFIATEEMSPGAALLVAIANVAPLILLAVLIAALLSRKVLPQPPLLQVTWQFALAIGFALSWYSASRFTVGLAGTLLGYPFRITGFNGPALAWQLFQGLVLYVALAAITYAQQLPSMVKAVEAGNNDARWLERYIIRSGDDFRPVDVSRIITIMGAQDYTEVTTGNSRHLVRLSLAEFESRLDPHRFIRVHRSTIIHLAHFERAELAGGGRMLAYMSNGERVPVSRAGVKALRPLIV